MSWPMPTATGQWNPGMAGAPDMNMGNYTPEQWAAVQQQNWQQWAQWQQQYAQWQSQYGEKYAQQMQAMQAMGAMPPLPATGAAPPPAPPPPEQPPPPPPHENNQPLYAPAPVPAPPPATAPRPAPGYNNATFAGNNQSWYPDAPPETTQSVNADALKKLAEEERLFDIQFQKWEEEIKKWKQDNVNHPDKEAYKEYESKFEACRVQLLERRQQMKQRRARLLGHAPAAPTTGNNNLPPAPPPNQTKPNYPNAPPQSQNYNTPPSNYQNQNKQQSQQQYNNAPVSNFNRSNNKNIDPQDRYESYQNMEDYSGTTNTSEKQAFLPASGSSKGIPGLDLVPDTEKHPPPSQDVIDITEDGHPQNIQPDYSKISKGINNILGDEKIMNILSMVRSQVAPQDAPRGQNAPVHGYGGPPGGPSGPPGPLGHGGPGGYSGPVGHGGPSGPVGHGGPGGPVGHGGPGGPVGHGGPSGPVGHGGPGGPVGHGGPGGSVGHGGPGGQVGHGGSVGPSGHGGTGGQGGSGSHGSTGGQMGPGPGPYNSMNNQNMPPNNQWNRNDNQYNNSFNNSTANNSSQQFDNRQNMPYNRQGQPHMDQNQGPNRGYNQDMGGNQYNDRNAQYGGPNMGVGPRGPMFKPNMPPRPLLDLPVPNNINDMQRQGQGNRGMQGNNMQGNNMPDNRNMNNMGMNDGRGMQENMPPVNQAPPRPKWVEEPLFTPSIIVEYEHKALRLKARDFIEPVHTFDYDHISKDEEYKQKDFESEVDQLFTRKPRNDLGYERREERSRSERERYNHESSHVFERRREREEPRDDFRSRVPPRDEYDERRRDRSDPYFDRRRDDRDKYTRREEPYRDREKERYRDIRREEPRSRDRSRSRERDRKRGRSKDSELSDYSKKSRENDNVARQIVEPKHFIMIDDILEPPGRDMRPEKIVIILRGPPGSGKSYLAKLIRDREAEYGGAVRIMSIDDYFMQEGDIEERDPTTGKIVKKQTLKYEYDEKLEETYLNSLKRAFKRSLTDGYFSFLIYDAVNDQLKNYADIWNFSRQNGFQVYICTMELDPQVCHKRNIHNRTLDDIQTITTRFFKTPAHHIQLDPTTLLQSAAIEDVQMEDATDDVIVEEDVTEVETSFTSKWEKMDNADKLARLDGTSKPLRPSQLSMEDYLQLDDWKPTQAKPGKKTVRWADIEERRQQEKMRAIGFVVGQTDWNRMTDPTMGSSALTQTKYIERVRRN